MKVVQINAVYRALSTGRTTMQVHEALKSNGHKSFVFCSNEEDLQNNVYLVGSKLDHKIHGLLSRLLGRQAQFSYFATRRMVARLKSINPDIVVLRNLHNNYINLPFLLRHLAKNQIPTIVMLHDCWIFTGHCTHYTSVKCFKWQTHCEKCPLIHSGNNSLFFDTSSRNFALKKKLLTSIPHVGVIGVSEWTTDAGRVSFLKNSDFIKRIYNWIDLSSFYPREDVFEDKNVYRILCLSAYWQSSAVRTKDLLSLCSKLPSNCEVVLVGKVDEDITLPNNVRPMGLLSDVNQLASIYSSCDVYVHLSHEDTFGKVVVEAMACGTPAIVYNATALPELVGSERGYVAEVGDLDDVLKGIQEISSKGKSQYAEKCIDFVKKNFNMNDLVLETIHTYEEFSKHHN